MTTADDVFRGQSGPPRFTGWRYPDPDRQKIIDALRNGVNRTKRKPLSDDELYAALERIEDIAADYLARKPSIDTWPPRYQQRKQLERLERADTPVKLRKAATALTVTTRGESVGRGIRNCEWHET